MDTRPEAAKLGWQLRSSKVPFGNNVLRVREDELEVKSETIRYAYLERAAAVIVVPVTRDGQMLLVRQYRYPVDTWCFEVPAGGTHDTGDDWLAEVARKELREETGATGGKLTYVTFFFSANALCDEKCHVFLAEEVELASSPNRETTEAMKVEIVAAEQAMELARTGRMKTAPCALAVLLCEPILKQRGYL